MPLISNAGQFVAKAGLGIVGCTTVLLPASTAFLAVTALVVRGLGSLREQQKAKDPKDVGFFERNLKLLSPYNSVGGEKHPISTSELMTFAAISAVLSFVSYKGLTYFGFGQRIVNNSAWLTQTVLPIRVAAPTFFGFDK